jgi:hypothetical protein
VAVDGAVISTRRGAVDDIVALQGTSVPAHTAAVDHVVAIEIAAVAIGAPLVAIGAVVTLAPRAVGAAAAAGVAAGRTHQAGDDDGERDLPVHGGRIVDKTWTKNDRSCAPQSTGVVAAIV